MNAHHWSHGAGAVRSNLRKKSKSCSSIRTVTSQETTTATLSSTQEGHNVTKGQSSPSGQRSAHPHVFSKREGFQAFSALQDRESRIVRAIQKLEDSDTVPQGVAELDQIRAALRDEELDWYLQHLLNRRRPVLFRQGCREQILHLMSVIRQFKHLVLNGPLQDQIEPFLIQVAGQRDMHKVAARVLTDLVGFLVHDVDSFLTVCPALLKRLLDCLELGSGCDMVLRNGATSVLVAVTDAMLEKAHDVDGLDVDEAVSGSGASESGASAREGASIQKSGASESGASRSGPSAVGSSAREGASIQSFLQALANRIVSCFGQSGDMDEVLLQCVIKIARCYPSCLAPHAHGLVSLCVQHLESRSQVFGEPIRPNDVAAAFSRTALTGERALVCCVCLRCLSEDIAVVLPTKELQQYGKLVLDVLSRENLNLYRLLRSSEQLRVAMSQAVQSWQTLLGLASTSGSQKSSSPGLGSWRLDRNFSRSKQLNDLASHTGSIQSSKSSRLGSAKSSTSRSPKRELLRSLQESSSQASKSDGTRSLVSQVEFHDPDEQAMSTRSHRSRLKSSASTGQIDTRSAKSSGSTGQIDSRSTGSSVSGGNPVSGSPGSSLRRYRSTVKKSQVADALRRIGHARALETSGAVADQASNSNIFSSNSNAFRDPLDENTSNSNAARTPIQKNTSETMRGISDNGFKEADDVAGFPANSDLSSTVGPGVSAGASAGALVGALAAASAGASVGALAAASAGASVRALPAALAGASASAGPLPLKNSKTSARDEQPAHGQNIGLTQDASQSLSTVLEYISTGQIDLALQFALRFGNERVLRSALQLLDPKAMWYEISHVLAPHLSHVLVLLICKAPLSPAAREAALFLRGLCQIPGGCEIIKRDSEDLSEFRRALFCLSGDTGKAGACASEMYAALQHAW